MEAKEEQLRNTPNPIVVTVVGIVMETKEVQL